MKNRIDLMIKKRMTPLPTSLEEAIARRMIRDRYAQVRPKKASESTVQYVRRIVGNALHHQFVRVVFNGRPEYVSFGVPGPIITKEGKFLVVPAEVVRGRWGMHYCLFYPDVEILLKRRDIFIRLDSGCCSGQFFGDITCDCREQFEIARRSCIEKDAGIIVNIPAHDGRGWGDYKMANQRLMDELGIDTVAAARFFYGNELAIDQRTYMEAVVILRAFGFTEKNRFCLATNNPRKIAAFTALGMTVSVPQPIVVQKPNELLKKNLVAKSKQWNHATIPFATKESLKKV